MVMQGTIASTVMILAYFTWNIPASSSEKLTHLSLDKMATILEDDIFKYIFLNENDRIPIQI